MLYSPFVVSVLYSISFTVGSMSHVKKLEAIILLAYPIQFYTFQPKNKKNSATLQKEHHKMLETDCALCCHGKMKIKCDVLESRFVGYPR